MKKLIVIALFVCAAFTGFAQQLPHYSQYFFNDYMVNPAIAGSRQYFDARTNHRSQWVGITDAPRTFILTVNGPFKSDKVGVGGALFTDVTGPTRRTGMQFSYAYHLKLNDNLKLSFGLSAGLLQFAIDGSKITLKDNTDLYIANQVQSVIVPDFGAGFYLYSDKYFVGGSIPQVTQNKLKFFTNVSSLAKLEEHIFLTGGYTFDVAADLQVQPSLLIKYVKPVPMQFDITSRFIYQEKYWLGLTYRTQDAISAMVGILYQDNLSFGYSYDYTVSGLQKYSSGTHEVMLGVRFGQKKKKD